MLDSARKYAQKGAKAKALKEYQLLLQADPRDAKLLLEVGDAYRRWGQAEDAIAQYAKVAQQYRQDGFDARAVAVYKQILNLDPKHYAAYVSLSELYQRMGLDSEAIGALQTAADGYHREGRKTDALELLRQMAALDPTNTTSRLKVAELLRQEKMTAEALAEYEAAARELENQQDRDQLLAVRERILELKPDHVGALTGMVRSLMVAGQLDRAEPFALRALQASGEPPQYELMIELFAQMGNDAKLAEATRGLAKLYRDRGDEDKARELMQRLPADEVGARSRLAVDVSEVDEPDLADDDLIDDDPFVTVPGNAAANAPALGRDELELDGDDEIQLEVPRKKAPPVPAAPIEADPDQLLAEASVYLRYGKRAQAIQSLKSVIDKDPNHRAALEKLGEAYVDDGQPAEAVAVWMRAAEQIKKQGDPKAFSVLRDRIATLDPKAAAGLGSAGPSGAAAAPNRKAAAAPAPQPSPEVELELELSLDDAVDDAAADPGAEAGLVGDAAERDGLAFEVEIDTDGVDLGLDLPASDEVSADEDAAGQDTGSSLELSEDGSFEFEIDPGEISSDGADGIEGLSEAELGAMGDLEGSAFSTDAHSNATSARSGTTTTTARIQEELEEAEFYIAQEMFDEAESILTRILEIAPNHPSALLRMGEVQVARGASPEAIPAAPETRTRAGRRVAGTSEQDLGSTARFDDGFDLDAEEEDAEALAAGDSASGIDVDVDVELGSEPEGESGIEVEVAVETRAERKSETPLGQTDAAIVLPRTPSRPAPRVAADVTAEGVSTSGIEVEVEDESGSDAGLDVAVDVDGETERATGPRLTGSKAVASDAADESPDGDYTNLSLDDEEPTAPIEEPAPASVAAADPSGAISDDAAAPRLDPSDAFDLREALADVFADPGESARERGASAVLSTVEDGFESIFSDFKKGVSATLDAGDYDTRYDLGIAYREMGLFEDAIGEFKICLESPARRFESLYLMGLCARDLQRYTDAVHHLEQALALPDLPGERLAGVFFDLSIAQSLAGDRERARANMKRVLELDRAFPGAAEKLAELESPATAANPAAGVATSGAPGRFESFDDLFSEDEEIPEATVESFESFDDVVAEEIPPAAPAAAPVGPKSAEAPAAPAAEPERETPRKGPRKKISFV